MCTTFWKVEGSRSCSGKRWTPQCLLNIMPSTCKLSMPMDYLSMRLTYVIIEHFLSSNSTLLFFGFPIHRSIFHVSLYSLDTFHIDLDKSMYIDLSKSIWNLFIFFSYLKSPVFGRKVLEASASSMWRRRWREIRPVPVFCKRKWASLFCPTWTLHLCNCYPYLVFLFSPQLQ